MASRRGEKGAPQTYCIFCLSSARCVISFHPTAPHPGGTVTILTLQLTEQTQRFRSGLSFLNQQVAGTKRGKDLGGDLKKTKKYMSCHFGFVDEESELL